LLATIAIPVPIYPAPTTEILLIYNLTRFTFLDKEVLNYLIINI